MPKTTSAWTKEQDHLVSEIIANYTEDGRVRWAKAFNEHPEWAKELTTNRTRAAVMTHGFELMRDANRLKKAAKPKAAPARKEKGNWSEWSDEQNRVLDEIITKYRVGKGEGQKLDYAKAFAENPAWRETFQGKSMNAIYTKGQKMLRSPKPKGEPQISLDVALVDKEPVAGKPRWEVNGCPNCMLPLKPMNAEYAKIGYPELPHCPNCTFPLGIVRTAIRVANKHHQRNGTV
jgi:hypothetical protein